MNILEQLWYTCVEVESYEKLQNINWLSFSLPYFLFIPGFYSLFISVFLAISPFCLSLCVCRVDQSLECGCGSGGSSRASRSVRTLGGWCSSAGQQSQWWGQFILPHTPTPLSFFSLTHIPLYLLRPALMSWVQSGLQQTLVLYFLCVQSFAKVHFCFSSEDLLQFFSIMFVFFLEFFKSRFL